MLLPVVTDQIDGQPITVKQLANVLRHLENDFVGVTGGMDLVGNALQVLEEPQASTHVAEVGVDRPIGCHLLAGAQNSKT
jgi:hypothetical protein